jgi:hypothetical protein
MCPDNDSSYTQHQILCAELNNAMRGEQMLACKADALKSQDRLHEHVAAAGAVIIRHR